MEEFGLDLVMSKVVSCQMFLKNDVSKASAKLEEASKLNKKTCSKMCTVEAFAEYNR